ncbi:MAG: FAD-dependent oxidoreductase [Bacteroidetes bacterium]|nr:FAD-dependent oxidoreductase [Bacteroidota bacterium]MDA1119442.1 FAD-dependent oxidoreductase [Bacteroidota bacterium]
MKNVDYIIIGQGLAGSILAYTLIKAGKTVHIFNQEKINTSSRVAAGLYNPITGRNMVKTWKADEIFTGLEHFYRQLELWAEKSFLYPIKIYRPFFDVSEQNDWQIRASDPIYTLYIESITYKSAKENIRDPIGGISLKPSGFVDINSLLDACRAKFNSSNSYTEGIFEKDSLEIRKNSVIYRGISASKIVFCTGISPISFFDWLPFKPVKGVILKIKNNLNLNFILNRGIFLIPQSDGTIKVGATYDWNDLSEAPTIEAEAFLKNKFNELVDGDFEIIERYVGLRPATPDRRPFIGMHPEFQTLCTFNGFGSKGVSLTPYCAEHFYKHLEHNENLNPAVSINRYYSLF